MHVINLPHKEDKAPRGEGRFLGDVVLWLCLESGVQGTRREMPLSQWQGCQGTQDANRKGVCVEGEGRNSGK